MFLFFSSWRRNVNHSRSQQYPTIIRYQRVSKDVQFAYQQKCRTKVKLAPGKVLRQSTRVYRKPHSKCLLKEQAGSERCFMRRPCNVFILHKNSLRPTYRIDWSVCGCGMCDRSSRSYWQDALATLSRDSYAYVPHEHGDSTCVRVCGDAGNFLPSRLT